MSLVTIPYRFTCRGGTAAALSSANEVPLARELYVETDTGLMKLGDGSTHYNSLNYINQNPATPCFQYTIDTTTTDSDPGTGKLRFNNATQNSATKLYIDDAEALSSTDLSAFFTELAGSSATGILHLTGILGTFKVYKWTAIDDGTGYFKFTVTHLCSSGNFTNGQKVRAIFHPMPASSGGGGAVTYVGSATISGSAATTLTMSGLDISTDGRYIIELSFKNATGSAATVSLTFNADTTATNYYAQFQTGNGSSSTAARSNSAAVFSMSASECVASQIKIRRDLDSLPHTSFQTSRGGGSTIQTQLCEHAWNSSANITSLTFTSSVANSLAVGSNIKVWKMT